VKPASQDTLLVVLGANNGASRNESASKLQHCFVGFYPFLFRITFLHCFEKRHGNETMTFLTSPG